MPLENEDILEIEDHEPDAEQSAPVGEDADPELSAEAEEPLTDETDDGFSEDSGETPSDEADDDLLCDEPETDDTEDGDEDDELLAGVFDTDNTNEANRNALMTVAIDYAFKRGKIKKNIRKVFRKLARKNGLDQEDHSPARDFMDKCDKRFIRNVCAEYGENCSQALDIAYFGAVWLVLAFRNDLKSITKNEKDVWPALIRKVKPEDLRGRALKLLRDKKGKSARILAEYSEKLNVEEIWDNIDEGLKKKFVKGAFWLGALRGIKG